MEIKDLKDAELASMLKSKLMRNRNSGLEASELHLNSEDMEWWRDAKLGFFSHWGLYSLLGRGEWAMFNEKIPPEEYAKLADRFCPNKFDAGEWAELAKEAGMRYAIMVTRHHDGFAMWDSPGSFEGFHSGNSAAGRDFVREYTDAFREAEIRTGLYYSPMDWRFPGYFQPQELADNAELMKRQTYEQVRELTTRYGMIDILWYDGGWLAHSGSDADAAWFWEPIRLNEMVRENQPQCVINPRSGWAGDFQCDEGLHEVVGDIIPFDWEKCFSIAYHWSYEAEERALPLERTIRLMLDCFVRGGNVLINVAPNPEGEIPANQRELLKQIGRFMNKNGEAIYGTRPGPLQPVDGVYGMTKKGSQLYLHVMDTAAFDGMLLPPFPYPVADCRLLDGTPVVFEQHEQGYIVKIPVEKWEPYDTVVVFTIAE
ncbi:alpha-L-fucosidase [Paenibacillus sp. YIM B09110]|uniref:alpha-L-fucosidase n=1 Tax=Paenibacillus sp. YIM B09110 TaxID=3126102 RepID=UPI00301DD6C1